MMPEQAPESFYCAITCSVMEQPVLLHEDGHTYEKEALVQWFNLGRRTSPRTNLRLSSTAFTDNIALRQAIDEWRTKHPSPSGTKRDATDTAEDVDRHAKRTCIQPTVPGSPLEEKLLLAGVGPGKVKSVLQLLEEEMRRYQVRPTPAQAQEIEEALGHNKLEGLRKACVSCGITFDPSASDAEVVMFILDMVHGYPSVASRGLRALCRLVKKKSNTAIQQPACNVVLTLLQRFSHHSDIVQQCCEVMVSVIFKTKTLIEYAMSTGACEGLVLAMKSNAEAVLDVFKKLVADADSPTFVVVVRALLKAKTPDALANAVKDCFRWSRHGDPDLAKGYCEVLRVFAQSPHLRQALVETGVIGVLHLVRPCDLPLDIMCELAEFPDGVAQMANNNTHKFLVQALNEFPENASITLAKLIDKEGEAYTHNLDCMHAAGGWSALIKVLSRQSRNSLAIIKVMELVRLVMRKWRLRGLGYGLAHDYNPLAAVVTPCTSMFICSNHMRTIGCDIMKELLLLDKHGRLCHRLVDTGACEFLWHAFRMGTKSALRLLEELWTVGHGRIVKAARGLPKIAEAVVDVAPGMCDNVINALSALRILNETGQVPVGTLDMVTGILQRFSDKPSIQVLAMQILNRCRETEVHQDGMASMSAPDAASGTS